MRVLAVLVDEEVRLKRARLDEARRLFKKKGGAWPVVDLGGFL